MKEEEKQKEYDEFLALMYKELEKTLEKRPKNPVTAFAHKYAPIQISLYLFSFPIFSPP